MLTGCATCLHPWRYHEGEVSGCSVTDDDDRRCRCKREPDEVDALLDYVADVGGAS